MKNIITIMLVFLLLISSVSAVQYHQQRLYRDDNLTTRIHSFVLWTDTIYADDYIKGDGNLEFYVWYNIYVKSWNSKTPDYEVESCNFFVRYNSNLGNESQVLINETYTENDEDLLNAKYFVTLEKGESALIDIDCKFKNNRNIDTPADFNLVFPTWECKACQFYEWSVLERDIIKAEIIGANTIDVMEYIKDLVYLNFEIWIMLFWVILIQTALIPMSLIFVGIYFLFLTLKRIIK